MKIGLSVIIITRNEQVDIGGCLESVRDLADEIIIADSGSTDTTLDIARRFTDKVFHQDFKGFGPQKQFALDKATGSWVLNLDADERVTPELADEIRTVLMGSGEINAYRIPFQNTFLGKRLRFGGVWGETHIRLFKKESGQYGDRPIHEGIEVDGPIGRLKHSINHISYRDISDYLEKCNRYTSMIAEKKFSEGVRFHVWNHFRLPYEFAVRYIFKLGFLDGSVGFTYALLSAYYVWLKFLKLRDIEIRTRSLKLKEN